MIEQTAPEPPQLRYDLLDAIRLQTTVALEADAVLDILVDLATVQYAWSVIATALGPMAEDYEHE